jgi:diguanylate cyclase (GGDEF)-like protein
MAPLVHRSALCFQSQRDSGSSLGAFAKMLMIDSPVLGEQAGLDQELALLRATVGVLRARLAELERLADTDSLTPLLNRRAFQRELSRAIHAKQRHGVDSALLYVDMNGLKSINDERGHAAGDAAILHVARFLRDRTRLTDIVGRIGGDEFAIVLTHIDWDGGQEKASQLVDELANQPLEIGDAVIPANICCGVTMIRTEDDAETALARADKAMYALRTAENCLQ